MKIKPLKSLPVQILLLIAHATAGVNRRSIIPSHVLTCGNYSVVVNYSDGPVNCCLDSTLPPPVCVPSCPSCPLQTGCCPLKSPCGCSDAKEVLRYMKARRKKKKQCKLRCHGQKKVPCPWSTCCDNDYGVTLNPIYDTRYIGNCYKKLRQTQNLTDPIEKGLIDTYIKKLLQNSTGPNYDTAYKKLLRRARSSRKLHLNYNHAKRTTTVKPRGTPTVRYKLFRKSKQRTVKDNRKVHFNFAPNCQRRSPGVMKKIREKLLKKVSEQSAKRKSNG